MDLRKLIMNSIPVVLIGFGGWALNTVYKTSVIQASILSRLDEVEKKANENKIDIVELKIKIAENNG